MRSCASTRTQSRSRLSRSRPWGPSFALSLRSTSSYQERIHHDYVGTHPCNRSYQMLTPVDVHQLDRTRNACKIHPQDGIRLDELAGSLGPEGGARLRTELYELCHAEKMEAERRRIAAVPRRPPDAPPMQRGSKSRGGKRKALAVIDRALLRRHTLKRNLKRTLKRTDIDITITILI